MNTWGFIGCGNMGGTLARTASVNVKEILVSDADGEKAARFAARIGAAVSDNETIAGTCGIVVLGVKPQVLGAVTEPLKEIFSGREDDFLIVSMAAGVSIGQVAAFCGVDAGRVLRIMPNLCASVGGATVLYTGAQEQKKLKEAFLAGEKEAGSFCEIRENLMDAGSAISGCGPAFVYQFIESLADGGVYCGLPRDLAMTLAAQTVRGAAEMVLKSGKHPGQLKDEVCSPGGTTIAGVEALERGAFRAVSAGAVIGAYERTAELGKK